MLMGCIRVCNATIPVLINSCKWVECRVFNQFSGYFEKKGIKLATSIGVDLHFTQQNGDGDWFKEIWTMEEDNEGQRYGQLVHVNVVDKEEFFGRVACYGVVGLGEGFVDGVWRWGSSDRDIVELICRGIESGWYLKGWDSLKTKQKCSKWLGEIDTCVKIGDDVLEITLGPWMLWSSAIWSNADNLIQAQLDKLEMIARKLNLKRGMKVLEIGCGWGILCRYLAEHYKVKCVGVTYSTSQAQFARNICRGFGIEIVLRDYRNLKGVYDRVVCVEGLDFLQKGEWKEFMSVVHRNVRPATGLVVIQTSGIDHPEMFRSDVWVSKHVFRNMRLPIITEMSELMQDKFIIEEWQNFGLDYARTFAEWRRNFINNWGKIEEKYDIKFYNTWVYYLCVCEAMYLSRKVQLWQIILSRIN